MLLSPELVVPSGPPPQAVLDQRCLWQLLLVLLSITVVIRMLGLDIAGALLSGLMLVFAVMMTRDGMLEMARYAPMYAVLCSLNFLFDSLPLLTEFDGRVTRRTDPGTTITSEGVQKITYTIVVRTTPFFDPEEGFVYNVQSLSMIMSPICMALGAYLAVTAHREIQRSAPVLDDELALGFPAAVAGASSRPDAGPGFEHFQGPGYKLTS